MTTRLGRKALWSIAVAAVAATVATTARVWAAEAPVPAPVQDSAKPAGDDADKSQTLEPGKADPVVVGVYVNQVHEFSLRENSFTVDFYVWFRWKNPALKPYETFSVIDGRIESKTDAVVKDLPGGEKHAYLRVVCKITKFFDTTDYPLDNHQLTIVIEEEDSETHLVKYVADEVNSAASPAIKLNGWVFARLNTVGSEQAYHSNFGDTSLPTGNETSYARVTTAVSFTRQGGTFFFKLFFGLWICCAIAFTVFWIRPSDVDPRFGLGVGALFAAIASMYVIASSLPDSNVITLADELHLIAFAFIFVTIAQSTLSLYWFQTEREAKSKSFDRLFRVLCPVGYIVLNVYAILHVG
ncbi:MAG: hypothetical protein JNK82_01630 [Myxococcaceae bacterium]|nr:hypothetical protein [Myxococcaceae bacterium]